MKMEMYKEIIEEWNEFKEMSKYDTTADTEKERYYLKNGFASSFVLAHIINLDYLQYLSQFQFEIYMKLKGYKNQIIFMEDKLISAQAEVLHDKVRKIIEKYEKGEMKNKVSKQDKASKDYLSSNDFIDLMTKPDKWEKEHPTLSKLANIFGFVMYKIPYSFRLLPYKIKGLFRLNTTSITENDLRELNTHLAKQIKTALIEFKKRTVTYPAHMTLEQYNNRIDTIIEGCDEYINHESMTEEKTLELRKKFLKQEISEYDYKQKLDSIFDLMEEKQKEALCKIKKIFDDDFYTQLFLI